MAGPKRKAVMMKVGDTVRIASYRQWCGEDTHGTDGVVVAVHEYPGTRFGDVIEVDRGHGSNVMCDRTDLCAIDGAPTFRRPSTTAT